MSKKGQDNQRGINFQNKVALLYMLDHYRYANFTEIRFEGDNFEDFTLFFTDSINHFTFFYNFEVKDWNNPLSRGKVREIIDKEVQKGINRYSENGKFFIVAPSFKDDCKEINSFKEKCFFNSNKNFEKIKKMYQEIDENNQLLNWNKKEILFLKYVHLVELKEENINNMIIDRFHYEDSFFYSEDNLENIINRFVNKITDNSSHGGILSKGEIQNILSEFHKAETKKSESYNLDNDLGQAINTIENKLKTQSEFETLNHDRYITPISARPQAIFYITDKLKQRKFKLKSIKWFIEKILIKQYYFFQCLDLLKIYIKENNLTNQDTNFILEFIFKLYEKGSAGSDLQKSEFKSYSNKRILELLSKISACQKISNQPKNKFIKFLYDVIPDWLKRILEFLFNMSNRSKISEQFKDKFIKFLENSIPDWNKKLNNYSWDSYNYQDIPKLIKNLLGYNKEGLKLIFEKHDFTKWIDNLVRGYSSTYYDYVEDFINKDFKKNFPLVIKSLSNQFQSLCRSYGYDSDFYKGYEVIGGGYSGWGNNYNLHVLPLESTLSRCIDRFYEKTKDWEYLSHFVYSKYDKDNPVFVKRSFIPFLLKQLLESSEENPETNKFYKALESILKIKEGLPFTEDILANKLIHYHSKIKDIYLKKLVEMILYKYSKEGISYRIFTIKLLFQIIESGRLNFKNYLKKILLNKEFKQHYMYEQTLSLFESRITNSNINDFFNEIKNELDLSKSNDLRYRSVILQTSPLEKSKLAELFRSSSKKDLDRLASIIEKDLWNTSGSKLLEKVLKFMKNHLDLEDFYKRIKNSEYLKEIIIQLIERPINYDTDLSERIITLCIKDLNLCGESEDLHNEVAKGGKNLSISTMRAHLCFTIGKYIIKHNQELDIKSLRKLEKAFSWVKLLIDLDASLANKIKDFPKPNYYLRAFAIMPLINLAHHEIRNKLNNFKPGLGDEIKNFAFSIIDKTKEETEKNNYTPFELFDKISHFFDYIRDLDEEEAEKLLSFVECFRVAEANHFFIYYALFREKYFEEKGTFKSDQFKKILINICKSEPDQLKYSLSFTIYKDIENKRQEDESKPDFEFFEKIKNYWVLLFENMNKAMFFPLLMTLSFVLKNELYYEKYKKYFFQLIEQALKNRESSNDYFMHLDNILPAISKNNPDDLAKILFLILEKGDSAKGDIPFSYEVRRHLIPEINKAKNKISPEKICKIEEELKKYNETLG